MADYFRTYEIDHGAKAIEGLLRQLDGAHTDVGLPEGGHTKGRYSMSELAHVAFLNEFEIPAGQGRPFMRNSADNHSNKILDDSALAVDKVLGLRSGVRAAIGDVGEHQVNRIKQEIQEGKFAPLQASTVARKGHDMPLVETGQLFESIQRKDTVMGNGSFAVAAVETVGA